MSNKLLEQLDALYAGRSLSQSTSYETFTEVLAGNVDSVTLTALLVALKIKGETSEEIAGAASAMRDQAQAFERPEYDFSDLVGTGGDGHNTINISSAASVVAASCGIKVAKHGNRSVSSQSGSSDLFSGFGLNLSMSPKVARRCLDEANFCFLAAPQYHLGMKYVMPVRGELKTRTIFNVLGPLANPARPSFGIYGVYTPDLLEPYAQTLKNMGQENALVVHGAGLDEIALHDATQAIHVKGDTLHPVELSPQVFGISEQPLDAIKGASPEHNVNVIKQVFAGKGDTAHTHAIAINAATLYHLHHPDTALSGCFNIVMDAIEQGKPLETIQKAVEISQGGEQ